VDPTTGSQAHEGSISPDTSWTGFMSRIPLSGGSIRQVHANTARAPTPPKCPGHVVTGNTAPSRSFHRKGFEIVASPPLKTNKGNRPKQTKGAAHHCHTPAPLLSPPVAQTLTPRRRVDLQAPAAPSRAPPPPPLGTAADRARLIPWSYTVTPSALHHVLPQYTAGAAVPSLAAPPPPPAVSSGVHKRSTRTWTLASSPFAGD
jgi:hypothetical protein